MKFNILKRFCVFALILCIISGWIYIPVSAYGGMEYPVYYASDPYSSTDTLSAHVNVAELRAYLFEAFKDLPGKVDVSQFDIPLSDGDALKQFVWNEMPESFHVYGLGLYTSNEVTALAVSYHIADTKAEYLSMLAECDAAADVMLKGIAGNNDLTDVEKALLLHDRLAVYCSYDFSFSQNSYTMYGAFASGLAVCDGYSRAYAYLLRNAGIENLHCASEALNHAWNLVKIDGTYYHVDVTWDDATIASGFSFTYEGAVGHENFLRSNSGIVATGHNTTDYYAPATDTRYDSYFWQDSDTEFQLIDDGIYYFDNTSAQLKRCNDDKISGTVLYTGPDKWMLHGTQSYYAVSFTRLSSDGVSLFFSTYDTVYAYDLKSSVASVVYTPDLKANECIYGFTYTDGYLKCDLNVVPYGQYADMRHVQQFYVPNNLDFYDVSVTLESSLKVNFKTKKALFDITGYEDPYAVFEINGEQTTVTSYTVDGKNCVFSFCDIAPDMIKDGIKASLHASFGGQEYASAEITISIADYCYTLLGMTTDADAELRTLLVDLLNYGTATQAYTGYNTADPANAALTSEQRSWGTQGDPVLNRVTDAHYADIASPSVTWKSAGLNLNDSITMRFTFTVDDITGVSVKVKDGNGAVLGEINDLAVSNGGFTAYFKGLNAADMKKSVYVTAYRGDTAISSTLLYSIESYAYAKQNDADANLAALVKAMMNYGISAYNYIH